MICFLEAVGTVIVNWLCGCSECSADALCSFTAAVWVGRSSLLGLTSTAAIDSSLSFYKQTQRFTFPF